MSSLSQKEKKNLDALIISILDFGDKLEKNNYQVVINKMSLNNKELLNKFWKNNLKNKIIKNIITNRAEKNEREIKRLMENKRTIRKLQLIFAPPRTSKSTVVK